MSALRLRARVAQTIWWALPALALLALGASWMVGTGRAAPATASPRGRAAHRALAPRPPAAAGVLRVCADPNNLPYSDRQGRGFENRIAELIARDLHQRVAYTWWPGRDNFVRKTLDARLCDVVIGIDAGDDDVVTSTPYYRSTYVFVQRRGTDPIRSFDDPRLRRMRVGVHVIGDDALPPGVALVHRHLAHNIRGYTIYGNHAQPRLIEAVARGAVDVAVAWGPLAGYFASRASVPLTVTPVADSTAAPGLPFTYAIALGVRYGDRARLSQLETVLRRRAPQVRAILRAYGVPLVADRSTLIAASAGEGR